MSKANRPKPPHSPHRQPPDRAPRPTDRPTDGPASSSPARPTRPARPTPSSPRRAARPVSSRQQSLASLQVEALLARANTQLYDPNVPLPLDAIADFSTPPIAAPATPTDDATPTQPVGPFTGDLTDPQTLRALLRRHGLRPRHALGQNFLTDRDILATLIAAADLHPSDHILEVGSGTGVLTVELAQRAAHVVAVELDHSILPVLRETTARFDNVEIIPGDLLTVDPTEVFGPTPYKVVANLPYYITALTLRHFLEATNPPRALVVMVQWEVAQRLTAAPGDLSLLGLSVQFYGSPRIVARVPAAAFFPPPQVDSAIVRVDLFDHPLLPPAERDHFFGIAHAGFAEKRKQLHNSLARNLGLPQPTIAGWLAALGIDPTRRAETLSMDEWLRLAHISRATQPSPPADPPPAAPPPADPPT